MDSRMPVGRLPIRCPVHDTLFCGMEQLSTHHRESHSAMNLTPPTIKTILRDGLKKGLDGYLWLLKILVPISFITMLLVILEVLKQYHVIGKIVRPLGSLLSLMGVDRRMGLLWLTAVLFGLAYGSAVIVEEAREGDFSGNELERLHASIGINHAVIEDPVLFIPFGVHPFWLWVPRLAAAKVAVQFVKCWQRRHSKKRSEPAAR